MSDSTLDVSGNARRLATYIRGKPHMEALLAAIDTERARLDTAAADLLANRWIDTGEGVQLDQLGKLLGQDREGVSDADYRPRLRARVIVNRAAGLPEDMFSVFRLFTELDAFTFAIILDGGGDFVFDVGGAAINSLTDDQLSNMLRFFRALIAAGVRGQLQYPVADPANTFTLDSAHAAQGLDNGIFCERVT